MGGAGQSRKNWNLGVYAWRLWGRLPWPAARIQSKIGNRRANAGRWVLLPATLPRWRLLWFYASLRYSLDSDACLPRDGDVAARVALLGVPLGGQTLLNAVAALLRVRVCLRGPFMRRGKIFPPSVCAPLRRASGLQRPTARRNEAILLLQRSGGFVLPFGRGLPVRRADFPGSVRGFQFVSGGCGGGGAGGGSVPANSWRTTLFLAALRWVLAPG